jgi:hypothetical protein
MATFNKFNSFVEAIAEKVHNLGSDQLVIALTNSAPTASNTVLADITQITYTNLSSRNITTSASSQTGGLYKLVLTDLVLTATGAVGPFRYIVVYNDTPTSPADPLIGWYDYGSSISLASGETLTIDFDASNGLLNLQ